MKTPRSIQSVIESFERLPGIGPKSATRLAYYLLHVPQEQLDSFARSISELKRKTMQCEVCMNISEGNPCVVCTDTTRDSGIICVVEQPLDVVALERVGKFGGVYHVLHGAIDPLNHIGPDELFVDQLMKRVSQGEVTEVILGLNPTMEGEATAMYLKQELRKIADDLVVTRLAQGLPLGGDVEYADAVTLGNALEGRREY